MACGHRRGSDDDRQGAREEGQIHEFEVCDERPGAAAARGVAADDLCRLRAHVRELFSKMTEGDARMS
jgi:hypothetical protein